MKKIIERSKYQILISLAILIVLILGFSYAIFTYTIEKSNALNITVGDFSYKITGDGIENDSTVTLSPNTSKEITLKIQSMASRDSDYQLYYKVLEGGNQFAEEVLFLEDTVNNVSGTIKANETLTVKLIIENKESTNLKVLIGVQGGLVGKEIILNGATPVKEEKYYPMLVRGEEDPFDVGWLRGYLRGYFWDYKSYIKKVIFASTKNPPENSVKEWDLSVKNDKDIMGYLVGSQDIGYTLHIQANTKIYANTNSSKLFANFSGLTTIEGLENLDTSKATDMLGMFYNCESLTELNLSTFNTSKVTNMYGMFLDNYSLQKLDLSNFDVSNVTNMVSLVKGCSTLSKLDLSSFNTTNVTDMGHMFYGCFELTELNLSSFNTTNVTDMSSMFYNCKSLTELNLSNFSTPNLTTVYGMFNGCRSMTSLDIRNFDTSKVIYNPSFSGDQMFYGEAFKWIIKVRNTVEQEWVIKTGGIAFSKEKVIVA